MSGKTTAKIRAQRTDCCGRTVAMKWTGASAVSGRVWCVDHVGRCAVDKASVLADELAADHDTGALLCGRHRVDTRCGRVVLASGAIRLEDGAWECSEHYGICPDGEHATARETAVECARCDRLACGPHVARCSCHHALQHRLHLEPDAYQPALLLCPEALAECPRCGVRTAASDGPMCRRCAAGDFIVPGSPLADLYDEVVKPHVSWLARSSRVVVSGHQKLAVFVVPNLMWRETIYRVEDRVRVWRASASGAWERLA